MSNQSKQIVTGLWTNYSKGHVYGATITLQPRDAAFLVAFLAMFVTWSGTQLWSIIRFAIHAMRSSAFDEDGLHHQHQAIIRNSGASGSLWSGLSLAWSWKRLSTKPWQRTLPVVIVAALYLAAFITAGIFSSSMVQVDSEVLLIPNDCGFARKDLYDDEVLLDFSRYTKAISQAAMSYTHVCYADSRQIYSGGRQCQDYSKQRIGNFDRKFAPCPFHASMCNTTALELDSGFISSEDLGINTRPEDRLWLRKVNTFSPINVRNVTVAPGRRGNELIGRYHLGSTMVAVGLNDTDCKGEDYTFLVSNLTSSYRDAYNLLSVTKFLGELDANIKWFPIPELRKDNADVSLIFLANPKTYTSPVADPWFRTVKEIKGKYMPALGSILGVTMQYQWCTAPKAESCSTLNGTQVAPSNAMFLNERQRAVNYLMRTSLALAEGHFLIEDLAGLLLVANDYTYGPAQWFSKGLPENQWMLEAENLFNLTLASWQHRLVEFPSRHRTGVSLTHNQSTLPPTFGEPLCGSIKARSFEHQSFSQLGLGLIIGIGGLISLIDFCLEDLTNAIRKRSRSDVGLRKMKEWQNDHFLQMLRARFEARGIRPWRQGENAIPLPDDLERKWKAFDLEIGRVSRIASYDTVLDGQNAPGLRKLQDQLVKQWSWKLSPRDGQ